MFKRKETKDTSKSSINIVQVCRMKLQILSNGKLFLVIFLRFGFFWINLTVMIGATIFLFVLANFAVLRRDIPPLTGQQSLLKIQPAISVLPRPDSLTSVIRYRVGRRETYGNYMHDLHSFEQNYERHAEQSRLLDCTHDVSYIDHPKFSCKFSLDLGTIGCNIGNQYGFEEADPCVLVKLNRVLGWMPKFGEESLNSSQKHGFPAIKIKCEGVNDIDKINAGRICYYDEESALRRKEALVPEQEGGCSEEYGLIRHYYFPYKKQRNYQTPFVWVKFYGIERNVVVMIQCWPIVDNIELNEEDGTGYTRFEMLVD